MKAYSAIQQDPIWIRDKDGLNLKIKNNRGVLYE
jgi:hypothetical protein